MKNRKYCKATESIHMNYGSWTGKGPQTNRGHVHLRAWDNFESDEDLSLAP
jgi:hypothetical protein